VPGAAQVILQNPLTQKVLRPKQAASWAWPTSCFEAADFLERSLEWAAGVVQGDVTSSGPRSTRTCGTGVLFFAKQQLDERLHGAVPSANKALELLALAKEATFEDGTAAETEALADLIMGDESRASLYAFDLVQRRAKRPVGVPDKSLARKVTKVGIVGAGLMASQLALLFARRLQVPVVLTDLDQSRVDKGVATSTARSTSWSASAGWTRAPRPSCAAWSAARSTSRLRRRRLRDRGGLREPRPEEADLGRAREDRHPGGDPRHQHQLAVDHRDGGRPRAPRAGRRLPLLQPGRGPPAP
jgi:hypothetical protein